MVRWSGRDGRQERIPKGIVDGMRVPRTVRKAVNLRKVVDTQRKELAMNIIPNSRRTERIVPSIETDLIFRGFNFGNPQTSNVRSRFSGKSVKIIVEAKSRRIRRNHPTSGPTTCADIPIEIRFHITGFPVQRSAEKGICNVADDLVGLSVLYGKKKREGSDGPIVRWA